MTQARSTSPARRGSRRKRKIWLSLGLTLLGIAALTALTRWVERRRNTDFADPASAVTASFKDAGDVTAPPIRFRDVAQVMGISVRHGPGPRGRTLPEDTWSGIAWGDYDGDGDWDLYVVNFPGPLRKDPDPSGSNRLFRNDGERFTDVTESAGVADLEGFGMGASFADYDGDGHPDLYVTNFGPNRLYRNLGDGTFEEVASEAGVADPLWSTGVAWGDFDRDGNLDLYVCNYVRYDDEGVGSQLTLDTAGGSYSVPFTLNPNSFDPQPNRLYRNRGDGTFEEVAEACGVINTDGRSLAAVFCDLDGDGWLDLYVNNDVSSNKLYRNMTGELGDEGPAPFADLSAMTGTADPRGSMGLSVGEIGDMSGAQDGLPDLFITHWVAQENALYQSVVTSGGSLEYRDKTRQFRLGEISIDTVGWGTALVDLDLDGRIDLAVANGSTLEQKDDPSRLIPEPIFLFWNRGKQFHNVAPAAGKAVSGVHGARGLAAADFDGDGDVDLAVAVNRGQPLLLRNETETANRSLTVILKGTSAVRFGAKVTVTVRGKPQVRWCGADVSFLSMHGPELIFGLGTSKSADQVRVSWADGEETTLANVSAGRVDAFHPDVQPAAQRQAPGISSDLIDRIIAPFNRGVSLMDQYQPREAAKAFDEVVRLAPDWGTGRLNLGIALLNAQRHARAEEELKWVIEKDPDHPYGHYALGMLLRHMTRFDEAKAHFERVLKIDPEDADAHYQLGILVIGTDPVAARSHFEKTLEKIPHHEAASYRLQSLLRKAGEQKLAREWLLRFRDLKTSGAGVFSGMKYGQMGRYAEVIRAFEDPVRASGPQVVPAYTDVAKEAGLTSVAKGLPGWPGEANQGTAATLGPGIAAADVAGKGDLYVYITGAGPDGKGVLYHCRSGKFSLVQDTGIDGHNAVGAYFGDYDGDGDPDLYLTCIGPNRLYRNEGGARFTDVTNASGTGGGTFLSAGAAWADADHDGDLDLYVANVSSSTPGAEDAGGAPNTLWRNNGDGSFAEMAAKAEIDGGNAVSMAVLFFDIDGDQDLDIYLINHGSSNRLFLNDRVGRYTDATSWFPELADTGPGLGALLGDLDQNGREDILLLRGSQPPRLFLRMNRRRFVEDKAFGAMARRLGGAIGGIIGDIDLDGDFDLTLLGSGADGRIGHRIVMNRGAGRFDPPVLLGEERAAPDSRGAFAADLDGDGSLELIVTRVGARPELWRAPAPKNRHWLEAIPVRSKEGEVSCIDPSADGLLVEIKSGRRLQVARVTASAGYLGAPPRRVHFGLGEHAKADYVRLSWTDAVIQSELEVAADQRWRVTKLQRKPSSCPILFSWNGERFAFVTDFLGGGGVGFFVAPGDYAPPDPTEDVRIPPESIAPRAGRYLLRVAEPLEEVTYFDELHLIAYDHPDDWELYPDERFGGSPPLATGRPIAVAEKIFPKAARNDRGEDMLDRIRAIDRRYVDPPRDARFVGYAADHWLELDFGERLQDPAPKTPLVLFLYGWVEYTYSHINYAAFQAGLVMRSPSIEIPDGSGGWRVAAPDIGFPAGLPRMMTIDISTLPIRDTGRLRIRTNMEVFWDQIFVGEDVSTREVRVHTMRPSAAELRPLGYPREYSPDGADPTLYDYHRIDHGVPFKNMAGSFTRFGDVRELLASVDDRFVIMARGEELALEFDAGGLPPLPEGSSRSFVLHADGYCKDMDLYTAFPATVEPLPYHGMANYPPAEGPPNAGELRDYGRVWNTRKIAGP